MVILRWQSGQNLGRIRKSEECFRMTASGQTRRFELSWHVGFTSDFGRIAARQRTDASGHRGTSRICERSPLHHNSSVDFTFQLSGYWRRTPDHIRREFPGVGHDAPTPQARLAQKLFRTATEIALEPNLSFRNNCGTDWSSSGPRKNVRGLLVDGILKDRTVVIGRKFNVISAVVWRARCKTDIDSSQQLM